MSRKASWQIDALLVLMVLIWGVNYSVIKRAFAEIPPQPFNALRLMLASSIFLIAIRVARNKAQRSGSVPSSDRLKPMPARRHARPCGSAANTPTLSCGSQRPP